jgi:methionyl-tRNA formyltransferase
LTDQARTIFLGTGPFAVPIVSALAQHPLVELLAVVTAPRRTGSRGKEVDPPVAIWAADHGVPTFRPARLRTPSAVDHIRRHQPDLLVLADYGQIVPIELLDLPRHGALNLHPSLLPRWRGASPIPAAILAGDTVTGVTLMRMDAGLDSGPIIAQTTVGLNGTETAPELEEQLAGAAANLLADKLDDWLAQRTEARPQSPDGVTMTKQLHREDGRLDLKKSAAELERQLRAYQPWPGSWLEVGGERLVVWKARVVESMGPGAVALKTGAGILELVEVQPAGGRRMPAADYARGRRGAVSSLNEGEV